MQSSNLYHDKQIILAPMAGVSDEAFREICLQFGAQLTYTEMVSAKALSYGNEKTKDLLTLAPSEDVVAVQIFGHEPKIMAEEAHVLEQTMGENIFSIDVNMGCPARKIAGKGDGSALMRDPMLAGEIVEAIANRIDLPVTVKMRRGYEMGNETAPELARIVEASGACAITVHGRFAQQFYFGEACWDAITRVKETVSIPVVGNGDITSGERAFQMIARTGCDAVMVGRGAQGNPWIFTDIASCFAGGGTPDPPSPAEKIKIALMHAHLLTDIYGDNIVKMRKHAMWYLRGLRGAANARRAINDARSYEDFKAIFEVVLESQPTEQTIDRTTEGGLR